MEEDITNSINSQESYEEKQISLEQETKKKLSGKEGNILCRIA